MWRRPRATAGNGSGNAKIHICVTHWEIGRPGYDCEMSPGLAGECEWVWYVPATQKTPQP